MNIVIVCDAGFVDGGAAKVAVASARGLADAGEAVTYVCATTPIAAELNHPRIDVRCLDLENVWNLRNPLTAAARGIWNTKAKQAFNLILAEMPRKNTLVHFHQWTKALSPSVLSAPALKGLPAIVSLHDYFLLCPNGAYYSFPAEVPCTLVPLSAGCIAANCDRVDRKHKTVRVLRHYAMERALAAAGISISVLHVSAFARRVAEPFVSPRHRQYTLVSPIDVVRGPPTPVAENTEFVFVGRMTEEKGVRLLAKTAHDAGIPLAFVGDGPLLEDIQKLGGLVRCTGWLGAAELQATLRRARALVFPSKWYETGGLVVTEALAKGIPVIVSRLTAAADHVKDDANGYLFDPNDVNALLACMKRLSDDATAARLGAEAYARYWESPQTVTRHVEGLGAIYTDIIDRHRTGGKMDAA